MGMKAVSDIEQKPKPKRSVLILLQQDDKYEVIMENVTAKQFLRPMLQAAEKALHLKLARHET
jgi:hypothetical protein